MNGFQRITAVLRGERADRVPVMLHNFMMAAREAGITMRQFRDDPEAIVRSFIQAVETYGYDGIVVDIDTTVLAGAVGVPVDYPEDYPARTCGARLRSLAEADGLEPPDLRCCERIQVALEAVARLKRHFGDEIMVRGNCDQSPFSLACAMRSPEGWMTDLAEQNNHEAAHLLLEYCTGVTAQFLRLMADTGAHMLSNGDSPAGPEMISPAIYREFAFPYECRITACSHELGLPYALHICGKTDRILLDMAETGADALELDYKTDVKLARQVLGGRSTFIGNIDPSGVLALGTPASVEQKTRELLETFAGEPRFILNAGCAIPADTPSGNLRAMIRVAREFTN